MSADRAAATTSAPATGPAPAAADGVPLVRSVAVAVAEFDALAEAARYLEAAGLDRAWATELRSRDAIVRALHMATHTRRIAVGTGIAYAFTRHPLAVAAAAVEGQAATGGRLTIGLGAGTAHTRGEFGIEFDHPAARLSEYVRLVRAALEADGGLEFDGRFYRVSMPGFRFGHSEAVRRSARIYGAALNVRAVRAMARSCNGIALHPFGHWPPYLDRVVLPAVAEGSSGTGRPVPAVAAWYIACAADDPAYARDLARAQVALYAAQPGFAAFLAHTPWAAVATAIQEHIALGSGPHPWREIGRRFVPDEMLDGLTAAGAPDEVRRRIAAKEAELAVRGIAELTLQVPGVALPADRTLATVKALADCVNRPLYSVGGPGS